MRNSWKMLTAIGAGLLVVAGPSVNLAAANDVPSPQSGTAVPNPGGPPNAYNPGTAAEGGQQANADSAGGPQTGKTMPDAPAASTPANTGQSDRPVTKPDWESNPATDGNQPAPTALPADRAGQKQAPAAAADPTMPQDPKMPSGGGDEAGSDMNLPNVTSPSDGPDPIGPTG